MVPSGETDPASASANPTILNFYTDNPKAPIHSRHMRRLDLDNLPPDDMHDPYISVIIAAHKRKRFVMDAINSALNQTLSRSKFEIVVVKCFKDREIDRFIASNGITNIYTKDATLGGKLAKATKRCAGDVVAFLEDDDQFERGRLKEVYDAFRDDNVGVYNNRDRYIDEFGNPLPAKDTPYINRKYKVADKEKLARYRDVILGFAQNNSSIAMRKSILRLDILRKVDRVGITMFLLFDAVASDKDLVIDNRVFTVYRVHGDQDTVVITPRSVEEFASRKISASMRWIDSFITIGKMSRGKPYSDFIRHKLAREKLYLRIFSAYLPRKPDKRYAVRPIDYIQAVLPLTDLPFRTNAEIAIMALLSGCFSGKMVRLLYGAHQRRSEANQIQEKAKK